MGIAGKEWELLGMVENCWHWMRIAGNGWELLVMDGNCW